VLRIGVVEGVVQRDGAVCGVSIDGETVEADAVVLAMGPWTGRAAVRLAGAWAAMRWRGRCQASLDRCQCPGYDSV